jgi:hypothetical protein
MTTLRRAIVAITTLTAAIIGMTASTATAADFTVAPGSRTIIARVSTGLRDLAVEPNEAAQLGQLGVFDSRGATIGIDLEFVASPDYLGPVTVSWTDQGVPRSATIDVRVLDDGDTVSAVFTPRAAPGPCIVVTSGRSIDFGSVELGARTTAPQTTTVEACSTIDQRLDASVSNADAGGGASMNAVKTDPQPNEFVYQLTDVQQTGLGTVSLDNALTRVALLDAPSEGSPIPTFRHELTIAPGSATGEQFAATLTFTAFER